MAKKKQEIALQTEIETQEEWEELLAKEGLIVVDVYQEWCGPCKAMVGNLKRLKNEVGDSMLLFAVAKADTIDALERYRGKCEPCFLFFAGGALVHVERGANSPVIQKSIMSQLAQEHKVLDGNAERKEIRDPLFGDLEPKEKGGLDEEETEKEDEEGDINMAGERVYMYIDIERTGGSPMGTKGKKNVTVAIIKPDAVKEGKVDEILEKLKEHNIEVVTQEERHLTDAEAREFYDKHKDEEHYEQLIEFMTSGPSHILLLTKAGDSEADIIAEWRELIGPTNVEEAKETAPETLRAIYGSEKFLNALHGSDSQETAMRELAFFFPDRVPGAKKEEEKKPKVQRTLAVIRPDALLEHKDAIMAKIEEAGFHIAMHKQLQLTKEQAEDFYREHEGQPYFDELTTSMSSGPLMALALARDDAVTSWRDMLGPKEVEKAKEEAPESLRAQFSVDGIKFNPLHGSDAPETAEKELQYFFPMQQTLAVIKPDAIETKDQIMDKIKEAGFHIAARKETEISKEIAEKFYADHKDKDYFADLTEHMTSGPTLFMVLSREDAVEGWRSVIGPTDPEKAKEEAPDTLRAQFGKNIKENAVHGASTQEQAKEAIQEIFGDMEFNADGTVKGAEEEKGEEKTDEQTEEQKPTETQQEDGSKQETPAETTEPTAANEAPQEDTVTAEGDDPHNFGRMRFKRVETKLVPADQDKKEDGEKAESAAGDKPAEGAEPEKTTEDAEPGKPAEDAAESEKPVEETPGDDQKPVEEGQAEDKPAADDDAKGEEKDETPAEDTPAEGGEEEEKPEDEEQKPEGDEAKPEDGDEAKPEDGAENTAVTEPEDKPEEDAAEAKPEEGAAEDKPADDEKKEETPAETKTDDTPTEDKKDED